MRKVHGIIGVLAVGALLGTTVFREAVVRAAQTIEATITNVDGNGNIKVHEQGTATVTGNVHVSNAVGSPVSVRQTDEPFQAALCDAVGGLIGCGHPTDLSVPTVGPTPTLRAISSSQVRSSTRLSADFELMPQ